MAWSNNMPYNKLGSRLFWNVLTQSAKLTGRVEYNYFVFILCKNNMEGKIKGQGIDLVYLFLLARWNFLGMK